MTFQDVKIKEIQVYSVSIPLKTPVKMAGVTVLTAENIIISINGDNKHVGWGEASSAPTMTGEFVQGMAAAADFIKSRIIGASISSLQDIKTLIQTPLYGNDGAISAIEMAMLDLFARTNNCSLIELLGGAKRPSARALTMIAGGTLDEEISRAKEKQQEGFEAFKVKVGSLSPEQDLKRCALIRDALGDAAFISADANEGYELQQAGEFAKSASISGVDFFEQPVAADDVKLIKEVASVSSVPLGADEGVHSLSDISELVSASAIKGCSLKTIKLGGMLAVLDAANHAHSLGLNINLAGKVAETSISSSAVAVLSCLVPNINWDVSITNQYLEVDPVTNRVCIENGRVLGPHGIGLGTQINMEELRPFLVE